MPRWFASLPPLPQWMIGGVLVLALVGACYGAVQAVDHYPVSSWFAVTLYVALLGALAGLLLGLFVGTLWSLAGRLSRRTRSVPPS